jgi:hypothetical protein
MSMLNRLLGKNLRRGLRREQTLHSYHRTITYHVIIEEYQSKKEIVVAQQLDQILVTSQKEDF